MNKTLTIGFIGQGWIGKNYANEFEKRGFSTVRYGQEPEYSGNKEKIKDCDIVLIAVPTPTTADGFNDTIVRSVISLVGKGKIAVIKSTLLPGTTEDIQKENPDVFVLHSPEFLSTPTAQYDAEHPQRNIVGMPIVNDEYKQKAELVMSILPEASYKKICTSREAELIKYGRNILGYVRVVFSNIFYDLAKGLGVDWSVIQEAMSADPYNGGRYMNPIDQKGRGAGGVCFIKDYVAFKNLYEKTVQDAIGLEMLAAIEEKNVDLLRSTNKDLELLKGVYGK